MKSGKPHVPFVLLFFSLLTVTLWGAYEASDFLIPLSFAALLAFMMVPLVQGLKRLFFPEWLAILMAVIAIFAPLFTLGYFLSVEIDAVLRHSPTMIATLQRHWDGLVNSALPKRLGLDHWLQGTTLRTRAANEASDGFRILLQGLHALLSVGSEMLLVILLAVVMLISRESLRRGIDQTFKAWNMPQSHAILDESISLIERFLVARLAIVLFVAFADLIILRAFRVDFYIILAVFLGIMTLIPAIGFIIALTPTLLISLLSGNSLFKTLFLFGGLSIISALESHVLTPKWIGKRINLNLLTTFIGLFAGERVWGIPGMFLSLPLLAILRIMFSASPTLKPLGDLLSDREDDALARRLSPAHRKKAA